MKPVSPDSHYETSPVVSHFPLSELNNSNLRPVDAALIWFDFGFDVIPVVPGTKRTAVQWSPWLQDLTRDVVVRHWSRFPTHDVGFIVGPNHLVLDPDSAEAVASLREIESRTESRPSIVVGTHRGEHHFYRLPSGVVVSTSTRSVAENPLHIDMKTGRSLVVLAPSGGRHILEFNGNGTSLKSANDLAVAGQPLIDAVLLNDGYQPSRHRTPIASIREAPSGTALHLLRAVLQYLDADVDYESWLRVGAAVFHETHGSEVGFRIFDEWSATGAKYRGQVETRAKWRSFSLDHPRPVRLGTLRWMAKRAGHDWEEICACAEPFEVVAGEDA